MNRTNDYRRRMTWLAIIACVLWDAGIAVADFTFGEPTNLGSPVNIATGWQGEPSISASTTAPSSPEIPHKTPYPF